MVYAPTSWSLTEDQFRVDHRRIQDQSLIGLRSVKDWYRTHWRLIAPLIELKNLNNHLQGLVNRSNQCSTNQRSLGAFWVPEETYKLKGFRLCSIWQTLTLIPSSSSMWAKPVSRIGSIKTFLFTCWARKTMSRWENQLMCIP